MAKITTNDVSNFSESLEPAGYIAQHGTFEPHWPPKHRVSVSAPDGVATVTPPSLVVPPKSAPKADHVTYAVNELGMPQEDAEALTVPELITKARPEEEGEGPSAGTNSSTSGSKPEESGRSAPETEQSIPSPVPDAENPSVKGQATKPARSSSVSSTDTSTRGTGASRQSRSGSSEASPAQTGPTQDPDDSPK
jgi:hypothetical protein